MIGHTPLSTFPATLTADTLHKNRSCLEFVRKQIEHHKADSDAAAVQIAYRVDQRHDKAKEKNNWLMD
jgi:hypothetical protein